MGNVGRGPRNVELSLVEIMSILKHTKVPSSVPQFKIETTYDRRCRELPWDWGKRATGVQRSGAYTSL